MDASLLAIVTANGCRAIARVAAGLLSLDMDGDSDGRMTRRTIRYGSGVAFAGGATAP
jgi:hypothetical protein